LTRDEALELVRERLNALTYVENEIRAESARAGPAFERWANRTFRTLRGAGLTDEAERLRVYVRREFVLQEQVEQSRGVLESLLDHIMREPQALGLRLAADPTVVATSRAPWPLVAIALVVGVLAGVYGRGPVAAVGSAVMTWFAGVQLTTERVLSRLVDALTPGPALPMPAWIVPTAFWLLVAMLASWAAILLNVLGTVAFQGGVGAVWRSRRYRAQLAVAIALSAIVAALTAAH
jgi:hypothetical protein